MNRKRIILLLAVLALLALMVYLQIREWRHFDWARFIAGTEGINWLMVLYAVLLVYAADFLRAVRWKIFLRPTLPNAPWTALISPQYVGFAGLALLGRPGEFIRPYLIAKRVDSTLSAQMGIWFVERAFDTGAVALIVAGDLFLVPVMREAYPEWRIAGYALLAAEVGLVALIWAMWARGEAIARWVCRRLTPISAALGTRVEHRLRVLSAGLNAIHDAVSATECVLISLAMWMLMAYAYRAVTHAYPAETGLPGLDLPEVILLMGASVAGGVIQLPVIGGGSQLATIAVISQTFGYSDNPELAVSCGILLWLITFMSVIPIGLALAHREHISLRRLTSESQAAEHAVEAGQEQRPGIV